MARIEQIAPDVARNAFFLISTLLEPFVPRRRLRDPRELRSRRVAVQVWAEALHDTRMRANVDAGLAPLSEITRAIRSAKRRKRLPSSVNPEGLARVLLALIQGFVLQQAWQPDVDLDGYRDTVLAMIAALGR